MGKIKKRFERILKIPTPDGSPEKKKMLHRKLKDAKISVGRLQTISARLGKDDSNDTSKLFWNMTAAYFDHVDDIETPVLVDDVNSIIRDLNETNRMNLDEVRLEDD